LGREFLEGDKIVSGPYLFLTPHGLGGRSILVNFSYVLRAEPGSDGTSTQLLLLRNSDPDGLKAILVEESLQDIALRLQHTATVSGAPPAEAPPSTYGLAFQPQTPSPLETMYSFPTLSEARQES
jgi:hypothetical protein